MNNELPNLLQLVLNRRDTLSPEEEEAIRSLPTRTRSFAHGETIIPQGPTLKESCIVVSGLAIRAHASGDEEDPIVSAVHIPGDFVDLHGFVLEYLDHAVVSQKGCKVMFVPQDALREVTQSHPHLTRMLWLLTMIDAKINRAWLVAAATLQAPERIGHFLCELYTRYRLIGFVENDTLPMLLEQKDLARLFGFSRTHINRSVQFLRNEGMLEWSSGKVRLPDMERLKTFSNFDPNYLEVSRISR